MITKCANPECSTPFHYLRAGKAFRVDLEGLENGAPNPDDADKPWHPVADFWLCGKCAQTMTLIAEKGKGVTAVPVSQVFRRVS